MNTQKSFFYFFFFSFLIFLALSAGCRSGQSRGFMCELPVKEPKVAQLGQPKQKIVAPQGEATPTAQKPPIKERVVTKRPSQAKKLLAEIKIKLIEAKRVGPGEKRQGLLGEVRELARQLKALAKNGDAKAKKAWQSAFYKKAARLYNQLRKEKVEERRLEKKAEPKPKPEPKKEETKNPPLPEAKPKVSPRPKEGKLVVLPKPLVPSQQLETATSSQGMPMWFLVGLLGLLAVVYFLACVVNRFGARKPEKASQLEVVANAWKRSDDLKKAAKKEEKQLEADLQELEAKAEERRRSWEAEASQSTNDTDETVIVELVAPKAQKPTTAIPQNEGGKPKEASAAGQESDWQWLLARVRKAGMEYPADDPALQDALKGARAAEKEFRAACEKLASLKMRPESDRFAQAAVKVAAAVKKAQVWLQYWQEAAWYYWETESHGRDIPIYSRRRLGQAREDLAKARMDQEKFQVNKKRLCIKKGGKKNRGKK